MSETKSSVDVASRIDLIAEVKALREENRKLRDAWPTDTVGTVWQGPSGQWYVENSTAIGMTSFDTKDQAINAHAEKQK